MPTKGIKTNQDAYLIHWNFNSSNEIHLFGYYYYTLILTLNS